MDFKHLPLRQINHIGERRKPPGFGDNPNRDPAKHAQKLKAEVENVIEQVAAAEPALDGVDPSLIMKVRVSRHLTDEDWQAVELQTLSQINDEAVILFSEDAELSEFRKRLEAYTGPKPDHQKTQKYSNLFEVIDEIGPLTPEDRIGQVLKGNGVNSTEHFESNNTYVLDVELWCPTPDLIEVFIDRVITPFEQNGGELLDRYTPDSAIMLRVRGTGEAVVQLLGHEEVAGVDLPPLPDLESSDTPDPDIDEIGTILPPDALAETIGIVDSGINDKHPLLSNVVVGSFGVGGQPASDNHGHGTSVAAIAAYGDLEAMLARKEFQPRFRIASARVLDDNGRFPDIKVAHGLVEEAIRRLNNEYGCRVINMSLGDRQRMVGDRGTLWSESLDKLARELDLIIVVSAGNSDLHNLYGLYGSKIPYEYPGYLSRDFNRIIDPAGATNIVTVGSVAHVNGLAAGGPLTIESIASADEPSPFTRVGPGIRNSLKPDFVERGGNAVFDGLTRRVRDGATHPPAGILTLNHKYTEHLFKTASGTSYAAPLVAFKAAMLLDDNEGLSANVVRSLLALSAEQPDVAVDRLKLKKYEDRHAILGCGIPDVAKALFSDEDRVVLVSESSLQPDEFAIFEVPITEEYQTTRGGGGRSGYRWLSIRKFEGLEKTTSVLKCNLIW